MMCNPATDTFMFDEMVRRVKKVILEQETWCTDPAHYDGEMKFNPPKLKSDCDLCVVQQVMNS